MYRPRSGRRNGPRRPRGFCECQRGQAPPRTSDVNNRCMKCSQPVSQRVSNSPWRDPHCRPTRDERRRQSATSSIAFGPRCHFPKRSCVPRNERRIVAKADQLSSTRCCGRADACTSLRTPVPIGFLCFCAAVGRFGCDLSSSCLGVTAENPVPAPFQFFDQAFEMAGDDARIETSPPDR